MNSTCPTCGAVYAVTPKDVGRRLKCKKCKTALAVTDAGLVVDTPSASAPAIVATPADDFDTGGDLVSTRGKKSRRFSGPSGPGVGEVISRIGGIPTILFSLGTFLVIWFTFMDPIGEAAIVRASMSERKIRLEQQAELKKLLPKGKKSPLELEGDEKKTYDEKAKKINDDYEKKADEAKEEAASTEVDVRRSIRFDKYGQLFGFVLLSFGCIGYLRTEQPPLIMRIVAATVLALMLLLIFNLAAGGGGCTGPRSPPVIRGG
jgi:predicted Zn finger-like uncharacterized protein